MSSFEQRRAQVVFLFDVDNTLLDNDRFLADLESYVTLRQPAVHFGLVDDKLRILTAVKEAWGERVTTVFPRQGQYACAADVVSYPRRISRSSASAI